jgi:type I restriction enzyme S subunit
MQSKTPIDRAVASYRADWITARIDDIGVARINPESLSDDTPADYSFRYIDIGSVTAGAIDWSAVATLRFADAPSRARRVVRPGDTLIATVRPLLGSHAYADWQDDSPTVASTGFALVRCEERLIARLMCHLPFSDAISRQLVAWQCGTSYPAVTERDVRRLVVPLPPVGEQIAIAGLLDAASDVLMATASALTHARDVTRSVLHRLLERGIADASGPDGFPEHWTRKRLGDVADVGSGVTLGKDVSGTKSTELPYLRVANVQDGRLDLTEVKTVRVPADAVDNYRLEPGDVLMTEGGDIDKLGRGTIWEGQIPDCLHQNHVFRIRTDESALDPAFYSLVVESDIAKAYFTRVAKRTTNLASTNKTQVRAFAFPIPPTLQEQHEIVAIVDTAKAMERSLREKVAVVRALRKVLLDDLLYAGTRVTLDSGARVA